MVDPDLAEQVLTKWAPNKFKIRCKEIIKQIKKNKMTKFKQKLIHLTYEYTNFVLMLTIFRIFSYFLFRINKKEEKFLNF